MQEGAVTTLLRALRLAPRTVRGWRGDGDSRLAARRSGRLYLTFDDGPDERWTPAVLDELAREGVRATFFVIGERAERHPELIERTLAEGHEVELHCMRHRWHGLQTPSELEADTRAALGRARPRRGKAEPLAAALREGRVVVRRTWPTLTGCGSPAPRATRATGRARGSLAAMRAAEPDLQPGNVVVMHDGAEFEGDSRADTVALIAPLLEAARRRGLEPSPAGRRAGVLVAAQGRSGPTRR